MVRSGSMPGRAVSAPRVPFSQVQSMSGIETESGSGMVFAGHHKYRYWNRACIVFIQQSRRGWLACLKPTPPHHSNLIWGKPGLEEQAGGVYDASGGPPSSAGREGHARYLSTWVHRQPRRGSFVTSELTGFGKKPEIHRGQ